MARTPSAPAGAAQWPTLQQQLATANVTLGSALETFITENQDFSLLRPEEAHDSLDLPPWIRVYWRRLHPEGRYSANDPTGGYPLTLRETWRAMLRDQSWPARVPQPPRRQ